MDVYKTFFVGLVCQIYWVLLFRLIEAIQFKNKNLMDIKNKFASKVPTERILGGYPSSEGEHPFMAAIFIHSKYSCAGALITDRHILTAGHCFKSATGFTVRNNHVQVALGIIQLKVALRIIQLNKTMEALVLHRINSVYIYPSLTYDGSSQIILPLNDLAIVQLISNVTFSPNIMPVKIPEEGQIYINYTARLAGWGATRETLKKPNDMLLYTTVKIIDYETCLQTPLHRYFPKMLTLKSILCAFGGKNDGCRGDSGAPLIVRRGMYITEVVGIMSWGVGCGNPRYPAVYTNTTYFLEWIHNVTTQE